jgi:cap2 methyltransferase
MYIGGNFVLKIFTWYEDHSICLLYLLACCFKDLHAFKPGSSREGNSEVYLIALGFRGQDYLADYLPFLMDGYGKHHFI